MEQLHILNQSIPLHFRIKHPGQSLGTVDAVSMHIREQLMARQRVFEVNIAVGSTAFTLVQRGDYLDSFFSRAYAIKKPFVDNDFDYLKRSVKHISCTALTTSTSAKLTYTVQYATTALQEQKISAKIAEIKRELNLNSLPNDYEKVKRVYDFILSSVTYDYAFQKYTAYDALFGGEAVCEGCAILLYRLLRSVNVSVRIIIGRSRDEGHAWNIVKIGKRWYNMDVTWDLYSKWDVLGGIMKKHFIGYTWFLKGATSFPDHARNAEYDNVTFHKNHSMSTSDYR